MLDRRGVAWGSSAWRSKAGGRSAAAEFPEVMAGGCILVPVADMDDPHRALELAGEAMGRFDLDATVAHLSAAVRGFTAFGECVQAAMACIRLGDVYANALGNLTAGRAWFARARRLVEDLPPCLEQGWIAVAAMGCDVDDPAELLAAAELALDRARRFGDVNLETKALADAGLAKVQAGRISEGMALLDEAMALACGPADDTKTAAKSVCSFFTACYFAADFERAGSWAELFRRRGLISPAPGGQVFLSGHCDSVQATLLFELGRWGEAEELLSRANAAFTAVMPFPSWHPDIALADLRVRQGRCAEAEALLLGKDQAMQALLPAARLHLARGDADLARATARRGLRGLAGDLLRSVELLTVLVDAELALGDVEAALAICAELNERTHELEVVPLRARAAAARARALAAAGDLGPAVELLEETLDRLDAGRLPWLRAVVLLDLAQLRERAGQPAAAVLDARAAVALLETLDVTLGPEELAVLGRLAPPVGKRRPVALAELVRTGKGWVATSGGARARVQDTKGLRYLAELLARPGVECHALDLVDRVEGVAAEGLDRRALGDAGEVLDARARSAYRQRVEALRAEIDDALAAGALETAEARQDELDALVAQLAAAFGLGGRSRRAASAAERARLNVTRALRTAIAKVGEALPEAGAVLDRRVRTGLYCVYEPADSDEIRWIVQSGMNEVGSG
jgi:tetratricopeptide (TPR) repeat protein